MEALWDVYALEENGIEFKILELKKFLEPPEEGPKLEIGDITYAVGDFLAHPRTEDGGINFNAFKDMWEIFQEEIARKKAKPKEDIDYYGFDDNEFITQLDDDANEKGEVNITLSNGKVYKDSFYKTPTGYYNHFGRFIGSAKDILKDLKDSGELKITLDRLNKEDK